MGTRKCRLPARSGLSRTTSARTRPRLLPAFARQGSAVRWGYLITAPTPSRTAEGEVVELHCTYDRHRGGNAPDGRKVKGTIHWVSAAHALQARCGCMRTFLPCPIPATCRKESITSEFNPKSLEVLPAVFSTESGVGEGWRSLPVRAPGLLRRRFRHGGAVGSGKLVFTARFRCATPGED